MLNKTVEALNKLLRLSRIRFDFVFLMLMQFLIEGQLVVLGPKGHVETRKSMFFVAR